MQSILPMKKRCPNCGREYKVRPESGLIGCPYCKKKWDRERKSGSQTDEIALGPAVKLEPLEE